MKSNDPERISMDDKIERLIEFLQNYVPPKPPEITVVIAEEIEDNG